MLKVRIDSGLYEAFKAAVEAQGLGMSDVVREMILEYLGSGKGCRRRRSAAAAGKGGVQKRRAK